MTEKHFTIDVEENTQENALFEDDKFVCFEDDTDEYLKKINEMSDENEQLKQQLSDINGQLVMLDNCDNWDYDRMKHTVREIAEIIGYNGTINPKR